VTRQLPKVRGVTTSIVMARRIARSQGHRFTSTRKERSHHTPRALIETAHVVNLPKGQALTLSKAELWKIAMPLPAADGRRGMPRICRNWAGYMRRYVDAAMVGSQGYGAAAEALARSPLIDFSNGFVILPRMEGHERSGVRRNANR